MTDPILSISTTNQIGRLYQLPNGTYDKKISGAIARKGLEERKLFPSITNIISAINPDLEGYVAYMIEEDLKKGNSIEIARTAHITYRDATAVRGTLVHGFIEDFINANLPYPWEEDLTAGSKKIQGLVEDEDDLDTPDWMEPETSHIVRHSYKNLPAWRELIRNEQISGLEHQAYVEAFFAFCKTFSPKWVAQEATVYGKTLNGKPYAGTTDFIAEINGKKIIGDWKTTSKLKDTVALQLSAVAKALKMTTDFKNFQPMYQADEVWGVQLLKDGGFSLKKAENVDRAFEAFSSAREIWGLTSGTEKFLTNI